MEITKLVLTNFRGFASEEIDFNDKLNVIVGMNGAGKTSVLDALTKGMSWLLNRTLNERSQGQHIQDLDIKNATRGSSIEINVKHMGQSFRWSLGKTAKANPQSQYKSDYVGLTELSRSLQETLGSDPATASLPLVIYYPVQRAVLDIPIRIRGRREFDQTSAYDDALSAAANFRTFFEWFRDFQEEARSEEMDSLSAHINSGGDLRNWNYSPMSIRSRQLQAVKNAIYKFMPNFSDLRVSYSPLRMNVKKGSKSLNLAQLSGGEKCLLALVGDLARRLALANPDKNDPLSGEAIVLIDEIDLHLHPKWQRNAIDQLQLVFPQCQFIVTTHSPHVVTHVNEDYILAATCDEDGKSTIRRMRSLYGFTAEAILSELMGLETTRPAIVQTRIDELYELLSTGRLAEAELKLEELKMDLRSDPELVRASGILDRKKTLKK